MLHERLLTLSQAAKALPPIDGKRPHQSTIWRWAQKGIRGVRLETRRIGKRIVTSREALERFTQGLAELPPAERRPRDPADPRVRTAPQRERDLARAKRICEEVGI